MESPEGANLPGTYNASNGVINIFTFINNQTLHYTFININKVKLLDPEYPDLKPLVLIRQET